eukprot:GHRQ01034801.1.p1 GENE.GHRQ01034801.1~~GHRQ01034801.1.p1  ORF type:complete len:156 (-),score=36.65 GHRQ01034801.1:17-484(-)
MQCSDQSCINPYPAGPASLFRCFVASCMLYAAQATCDAGTVRLTNDSDVTVFTHTYLACILQGQPIKIWDACTGHLRASYRAYDDADEITAAASLAFSPDGSKLVAGYNKALRVFNVSRPGRECKKFATYRKRQEGSMAGEHQQASSALLCYQSS